MLGLTPQMVLALVIAQSLFDDLNEELTITSAVDSKHGKGSLHYQGNAVDLRTRNLSNPSEVATRLQTNLGAEFDVVLEDTHIHIEWQPKVGVNKGG